MAVTKDQLVIEIKIENSQFQKEFSQSTDKLKDFSKNQEVTAENTKYLNDVITQLTKSVSMVQIDTLSKNFDNLNASAVALDSQLKTVTSSIEQTQASSQNASKSLLELASDFVDVVDKTKLAINAFVEVSLAIEKFTRPETLQRIAKITDALGYMFSLSGHKNIGSGLHIISDQLDLIAEKSEFVRKNFKKYLDETESVDQSSKTVEQSKSLLQLGNDFADLVHQIKLVAKAFVEVSVAIERFTRPENLTRIAKMADALGYMFSLSGHKHIGAGLHIISDQLDVIAKKSDFVRENFKKNFNESESISETNKSIKEQAESTSLLSKAFTALETVLAGFTLNSIGQNFEIYRKTVNPVLDSIENFAENSQIIKPIRDIFTSTNALAESLFQVGGALEWLGNKFSVFFGNEKIIKNVFETFRNSFLLIGQIAFKTSINISNFATSMTLFAQEVSKAGDPLVVRMLYQVIGAIGTIIKGTSEAIYGVGKSIAYFGVLARELTGTIDTLFNGFARFVLNTARQMNLFGQTLYVVGLQILQFAGTYAEMVSKFSGNPIFTFLGSIISVLVNMRKEFSVFITSLNASLLALLGLGVGFKSAGKQLGIFSNLFFDVMSVTSKARDAILNFVSSTSTRLLQTGISVQKVGIDFHNLGINVKTFSSTFAKSDSAFMGFLGNGIKSVAGFVDVFANSLDAVAKKIANFAYAFSSMIPASGAIAKTFQFAGKITSSFGQTLTAFGSDIKNIVPIIKTVADADLPFVSSVNNVSNSLINATAGFASLGVALFQFDDKTAKFAGGTAIAITVAMGGILQVAKAATTVLGDFVTKAGTTLFTFFDSGIQLAAEDEDATVKYIRSITRLSESVADGEKNLSSWNQALIDIQETSSVTESDAQTFAVSIAKLGQELNLTSEQQIKLAKNISAFAKSDEELTKTTDAIRAALVGQMSESSKQAEELGIHLNQMAINNGVYANEIGKTIDAMTEQERVQAKLIELDRQAGKARDLQSIAGMSLLSINKKIKVSQEEIASAFAQSSIPFYKFLSLIELRFLKAIESISQPLKTLINYIATYSGAILIVIGLTVKWGVTIAVLGATIAQLNTLIRVSAGLQSVLATTFAVTNGIVGVQTVAITGLVSVFQNLGLFIRGLVVVSLSALGSALMNVGKAIANVTVAILTNPLFWKATAIATAIGAVVVAIKNMYEKTAFLQRVFSSSSKAASDASDAIAQTSSVWERFSEIVVSLFNKLVNLAEYLVGGLLSAVQVTAIGFVKLRSLFADDEDVQAYNLMLQQMTKELNDTIKNMKGAAESFVDIGDTAYAATDGLDGMSNGLGNIGHGADATATKLEKMTARIMASFDQQRERLKVLGDDYDRTNIKILEAKDALSKANALPKDDNDKAKSIAEARIGLVKAEIDAEKLRQNLVIKLEDEQKKSEIDALKASGRKIEAIKLEYQEKIKLIKDEEAGLKKIGLLDEKAQAVINNSLKSLASSQSSEIEEARLEAIKKSIDAISELKKKTAEYQAQAQLAGQSEYAQIKIKLNIELDEIDALAKKLEAQKMLTAEARQYVEVAKKAALSKANSDQADQLKKDAKDLEASRNALQRSNSNVGKTPYEIATEDQKRQLEEIEKQRAKFQEEGKLPKTGPMTPDQKKLSNELDASKAEIEKQQKLGHSESFNKAKDVGDHIALKMTTALEGPVMGSIMGAMQGAMGVISVAQGVIDMAQQLVDAIPKLLNSFANLVNSIVDLPLKLAEAIGNVINSVMNVIKNAIPNVIKAVINVVDAIRNFVREAPKQFVMMIDKSVEMITKFIDDLPTIAQEMAQNLTEAIPKTMAKSIEFAMLSAPKIMVRLIKLIYTELPPAIWHGIMEGFKEFGRVFQRWMKGDFSGQKMKLDVDTSAVKKQLSNLTKDSSRLFSVTAIADAAKNATNEAKKIDDAAKRAGKNMWQAFIDAMVKAWHNFLDAGGSIWQGILDAIGDIAETFGAWGTAIWNGLVNAIGEIAETLGAWGTAIWNGVVKAVGEIAKTFGEWGGAIWNGLVDMVKDPAKFFGDWGEKIWNGFLKPIGDAFGGFGTALWTGVTTAIGELPKTFGNWGKVMWNGFTDLIKDPAKFFGAWGTKIWNGFFTPIGDAFSGFGTAIFDGLKEALKGVGSLFSDLGGQIFNGLKAGLDSIGNVLSKMFQFDGGGVGDVEGFIGLDFPFVKFAKGGLVPGQAPIPGDSLLNDRIPALLSPGEVVLPRSVLGDEAFRRVVMAKLAGQDVPQLADGGFIGGVLGNIIPKWIRDLYDSISKYIGGIDLVQLAKDPKGTIENALRNNLSAFKDNFKKMVKGYAEGGLVTGPGGTDVVPGMLTAGEFVLNRQTVGRVGLGNLIDLNTGKSQLGNQTSNVTVNLTVNTSEKLDESFIRQRLMPAIRDELKRNSLDGRTIVYAGGVRK